MKQIILFVFCLIGLPISAQNIEFSFPKLAGKETKIFYFQGNRADSVLTILDAQGNGHAKLPALYRGMIQILVSEAGSTECIAGEPTLRVVCDQPTINNDNIRFPGSAENNFLYSIFPEKSKNMTQEAWLQAGIQLFGQDRADLQDILKKEITLNKKQEDDLNRRIRTSPLYAARFMEIMQFSEDLFTAENRRDTLKIRQVKEYIHQKMNWEALYTSGRFWGMTQNYYISLFNKEEPLLAYNVKQIRYANTISPLFQIVREPMRSALLQSVIGECDRFGWELAKDSILSYIALNKVKINSNDDNLVRILSGYKTRSGSIAPPLIGVTQSNSEMLVIFYESGCDNCDSQIKEIIKHYPELQTKGIRVISVSADNSRLVFEYHSQDFPWKDKLCDYKGFEGENFRNYGIIGTPTFITIDTNGKIAGRYSGFDEIIFY